MWAKYNNPSIYTVSPSAYSQLLLMMTYLKATCKQERKTAIMVYIKYKIVYNAHILSYKLQHIYRYINAHV